MAANRQEENSLRSAKMRRSCNIRLMLRSGTLVAVAGLKAKSNQINLGQEKDQGTRSKTY